MITSETMDSYYNYKVKSFLKRLPKMCEEKDFTRHLYCLQEYVRCLENHDGTYEYFSENYLTKGFCHFANNAFDSFDDSLFEGVLGYLLYPVHEKGIDVSKRIQVFTQIINIIKSSQINHTNHEKN